MPNKFKLPVVAILVFTAYIALQIFTDIFRPAKIITEIDPRQEMVYQQLFDTLELGTINGEKIKLAKTAESIVILNFWASWCGPCLSELPSLVELQEGSETKNIKIIGISSESLGAREKLNKTIKKYGINYSIVHDFDERLAVKFGIRSIPTTLVFKEQNFFGIAKGAYHFSEKDFFPNGR